MVAFKIASILMALGSLVLIVQGRDLSQEGQENETVKVSKCCEVNSILVEENLGHRTCKKRKELLHIDLQLGRTKWEPAFFQDGLEVLGPKSIQLQMGMPKCDFEAGDQLFAVSHSRKNDDELRSGSFVYISGIVVWHSISGRYVLSVPYVVVHLFS